MILNDVGDYLSTGGIGLTTGTNLWLGKMPDLPAISTALYETGGISAVHAFASASGQAVVERPRFQVVVRHTDYASGRQLIHNIWKRLDGAGDFTINSTRYLWIEAVQSPFFLKFDDNNRVLFAVNFDCHKALTAST